MHTLSQAGKLIKLARASILSTWKKQDIDSSPPKEFSAKQGVFVTLKEKDELRGCIGFVLPYYSLYDGIMHCAKAAAFEDPRFPPVAESEMKGISIEISILSVPSEINGEKEKIPSKIKIGRDGLIIKKGYHSGLLLPQVFTEYNATPITALEMTCEKAGLQKDSWKEASSKIESFQAQVFKELSPEGKIVEENLC